MSSSLGTQQKILKFYKWLPSQANKFQRWAICLYCHSKAMLRMSLGVCCLWYSNKLILMTKWHALFQHIPPLNVASLGAMMSEHGAENIKLSQNDAIWSHIQAIHDCEKISYASSGWLSIRNKLIQELLHSARAMLSILSCNHMLHARALESSALSCYFMALKSRLVRFYFMLW